MLLGIAFLALLALVALAAASLTRRAITASFFLVAFLVAYLLGSTTHDTSSALAGWALTFICGLVIESVHDTLSLLWRARREERAARRRRRAAREREAARRAARGRSRIAA